MLPGMQIAERYARLAHALDAHRPGFIDGYAGPDAWADRTPRPAADLIREAADLQARVQDVAEPERREWLAAQARAMHTVARIIAGEAVPYAQEVRDLYDIEPTRADLAALDASLQAMDAALPGAGTLEQRRSALRDRVTVPVSDLLCVAEPILVELRTRTQAAFGLPDGEDFQIRLVTDKPWGGYNWPLGNLKSLIELNTDLPVALTGLPDLLAHEGYPGHHTEHATKEARLVRELGWQEHHLQLLNAPECVVSEGVAVNALRTLMTRDEERDWLTGDLARVAGLDPQDVQAMLTVNELQANLKGVNAEAAMRLFEDGHPEAEVLDFLRHYGGVDDARARKSLEFITQPTLRAYIFTYPVGAELVKGVLDREGTAGFRRLLREPVTPGQLRG